MAEVNLSYSGYGDGVKKDLTRALTTPSLKITTFQCHKYFINYLGDGW